MTFITGLVIGGAIIYLCPGLGTGGSAIYKRLKTWWKQIGQ